MFPVIRNASHRLRVSLLPRSHHWRKPDHGRDAGGREPRRSWRRFVAQQSRRMVLAMPAAVMIAVAILSLVPRLAVAAPPPLTITLTSQEGLWLDENKCNAQGPRGAWLSFEIQNTGASALTNVTVSFSGFSGGTNPEYFKAPTDLTRGYVSLAAGAAVGSYFYVDYSEVCNHSKGGGKSVQGLHRRLHDLG